MENVFFSIYNLYNLYGASIHNSFCSERWRSKYPRAWAFPLGGIFSGGIFPRDLFSGGGVSSGGRGYFQGGYFQGGYFPDTGLQFFIISINLIFLNVFFVNDNLVDITKSISFILSIVNIWGKYGPPSTLPQKGKISE